MLTTLALVRLVPGACSGLLSDAYLNMLIAAADRAIKSWCKQNLELAQYPISTSAGLATAAAQTTSDSGYYSGTNSRDIVIRQLPVWSSSTVVGAASNNLSLPQSTINVASTVGFDPGNSTTPPSLAIQVTSTTSSWTRVTYTGTTATSFTGCSGGSGTLVSGNGVGNVVVYMDPNGCYGGNPASFSAGTQLAFGQNYMPLRDGGGNASRRGLIRRTGGGGNLGNCGFGWSDWTGYGGKLAGNSGPIWPYGDGNILVYYSAGYYPIPEDLSLACTQLVLWMARNVPNGSVLGHESLGAYSYSILQTSQMPEIGSIRSILTRYREPSFSGGGG